MVRSCYKFAYNHIPSIPSLLLYIGPLQSKNDNIFNAESRVVKSVENVGCLMAIKRPSLLWEMEMGWKSLIDLNFTPFW